LLEVIIARTLCPGITVVSVSMPDGLLDRIIREFAAAVVDGSAADSSEK
jgi:hypothetical protein